MKMVPIKFSACKLALSLSRAKRKHENMRQLIETNRESAPPPSNTDTNVQIEVLVCLTAFLLIFLVIFGLCRRRYNSGPFRLMMFAAYTSSTYVLTYTLGLLRESPANGFFPLWAMFLMLVLASADTFSAYQLEDNEQ